MGVHWRLAAMAAVAAAVSSCSLLTAERPLFSIADQAASAPIVEGVWIAISEQCPERYVRSRGRFPAACTPIEVRRTAEGAWRANVREDLAYGLSAEERAEAHAQGPWDFVLVPAVERALDAQSFAPLYVAEVHEANAESAGLGYAVVAPIGVTPATEILLLSSISCDGILRDGPIDGITPRYVVRTNEAPAEASNQAAPADTDEIEAEEVLDGCIAFSQAGVREAARRAAIENIDDLARTRLMRARP